MTDASRSDEPLSSLGEFDLIERIARRLGPAAPGTLVGAGDDDAAVLAVGGRLQLATIDTLVDGTHFDSRRTGAIDLGHRLAAVNLSDVAAMGGWPTHALAAMVAPPELGTAYALGVVDGLAAELARFGADLVGGNLARGDRLVLDLALLGEVDEARLLLRSGARAGDVVMVTGRLGGAAAARALRALPAVDGGGAPRGTAADAAADRAGSATGVTQNGVAGRAESAAGIAADVVADVSRRQDRPEPRLDVAPLLRPGGATAAIDISDGLASDLGHVCARSQVGVRIDAGRMPIDPAAAAVAAALGQDALGWALGGGEDYELLVTVEAERAAELAVRVREATGVELTAIGEATADLRRLLIGLDGRETDLAGGWRHFA